MMPPLSNLPVRMAQQPPAPTLPALRLAWRRLQWSSRCPRACGARSMRSGSGRRRACARGSGALEFIDLRATAEEEYALALSRAQGVWSTQKRRAFFSRDAGQAASTCLASAGQVGSLRDGLAAVVDVESERMRQLAADRAAALRELCRGADAKVDAVDSSVQELQERADMLLGELTELVSELVDSRETYDRCAAERAVVEA